LGQSDLFDQFLTHVRGRGVARVRVGGKDLENQAGACHVGMNTIPDQRQERNQERLEWKFHDEPFKDFWT
jgi:hypothetical protein